MNEAHHVAHPRIAAALFLSFFAFYLSGLCGTVPSYRDSGDLIVSAASLGIAHPPGYPLYVILAHAFGEFIPLASWAYRANVFSALCAAASVALLLMVLQSRLLRDQSSSLASFLGAALYGMTPAVISLARVAEMYTLSALFATAILLTLFTDIQRSYFLACFLLGLGLGAHPTLMFLVPLFVLAYRRVGISAFLFFLLGLSVFLFLPIRASQAPLQNWGNPSHWRNFWRVMTRADYGGLKLHPEQSQFIWSFEDVVSQLQFFFKTLLQEWGPLGIFLGFAGWLVWLKKGTRRIRWGALATLLVAGPGFFVLSNLPLGENTTSPILQPYLVIVNLLWALALGVGLASVWSWRPTFNTVASRVMAVGIAAFLMGLQWPSIHSQRHDFYTYDYGRNLMRSLPPRSVFYDPDDPTAFTLRTLQLTEGRRKDIVLLNFFRTRWGYEQILKDAPDLLPPRPIANAQELERLLWTYSTRIRSFYVELPQKLGSLPYHAEGLVYRVDLGAPPSKSEGFNRAEILFQLYATRGAFVTTAHPDFFTSHLIGYYAAAQSNLGIDYAAVGEYASAVDHYQKALQIDPKLAAAYNNWGIVEYNRRHFAEAIPLYEKAVDLDPENRSLRQNLELAKIAENRPQN